MTGQQYGTIKIPQDAYERHNEQRKELRLTWEEYIDERNIGDLTPFGGEVPNTSEVDTEALGKEVAKHTDTDRLYARLEELETNLKNKIEALQGGRV